MTETNQTTNQCAKRRDQWFGFFLKWKMFDWFLTISAVVVSAFVASSLSKDLYREWAALVVALCTGLQATLKPGHRADAYREAWVILDLALKKLEGTPPEIVAALRSGEIRIGDGRAGETSAAQ